LKHHIYPHLSAPNGRKIVIVDDNKENIMVLSHLLKRVGYDDLVTFLDPLKVVSACLEMEDAPDLFLLDVMMPGIDGISLARALMKEETLKDAYLIFVTARDRDQTLESCFEVGGADFITKPISLIEIRCRLQKVFALQDAERTLLVQQEDLRKSSLTDALTGLHNRRYLNERLEEECAKSDRYGHELCFMMVDLDHFKGVNDRFGHPVGDRALIQLAKILSAAVRSTDMVARFGGEEFCIVLTGTPEEMAFETADRIRKMVEDEVFLPEADDRDVTMSAGVASYRKVGGGMENLLKVADDALYEAKLSGRNKVILKP
jgi:diguanylate cyclase (GGDEF)-like protein